MEKYRRQLTIFDACRRSSAILAALCTTHNRQNRSKKSQSSNEYRGRSEHSNYGENALGRVGDRDRIDGLPPPLLPREPCVVVIVVVDGDGDALPTLVAAPDLICCKIVLGNTLRQRNCVITSRRKRQRPI
jgi:hypothetical protein